MTQPNDERIARAAITQPIPMIAQKIGISSDDLIAYGSDKAKIKASFIAQHQQPRGRLILVTATSPTPAGEGKTTVTIGLADALNRLNKNAMIAMREPSLGPVFGIKGGAAGGGYAQVVPMEDINLHFTGDLHAISAANNLLAALIDNHIHHGNPLNIHPKKILWRRVVDINDRQLRHIVSGMGSAIDGVMRADGFDITVTSEIMAILCLAQDLADLKQRIGNIIVAYNKNDEPIFARDLKAQGALTVLLKDAILPNLVQSLEGTPALVHGGPFANIAHGCNSLIATRLALALTDFVITEAGFGADLGAEKFCNIKCRQAGFHPDAAVIVTTLRSLRHNGNLNDNHTPQQALMRGITNLERHINNMKNHFGIPCVVAINVFDNDTPEAIAFVQSYCAKLGVQAVPCRVWAQGGAGGEALAQALLTTLSEQPVNFRLSYQDGDRPQEKIRKIAQSIYGAADIELSENARRRLTQIDQLGLSHLPICMAKTQYSFSDDPNQLGAPEGFILHIRDIQIAAGAGFLIALCGTISRMPGLPARPAAEVIDINHHGEISGLF